MSVVEIHAVERYTMTAGKDWHTTGKSIEPIIVKSRRAWLASALSVVVNAQADALTRVGSGGCTG